MSKEIHIKIDRKGRVEIRPQGFEGEACHEATERLRRRIGGEKRISEGEGDSLFERDTENRTRETNREVH